jgi:hypothetical protein
MKCFRINLIIAISLLLTVFHLWAENLAFNEKCASFLQNADSASLTLISSILYANECYDVIADDEFCYIIEECPGYSGQIKIIDIHNPSNPFLYSATNIPNYLWTKYPYFGRNISKNEDYLIVSYEDWRTSHAHLATIDVSDPSLPIFLDSISLGNGTPYYFDTRGSLAFIFVYDYYQPNRSRIISVDLRIPQAPEIRDTILCDYLMLSLGEHYLYTYWWDDSLSIYSFDSLGYMDFEGMYQFGYECYITGVHSSRDSLAFVFYVDFRAAMILSVIDVSDPANPFLITEDSLPFFQHLGADNIAGNDSTLFYTQDTLLCAIDISEPTAPTFLSASTFPSPCYSLFLRNDVLFSAHNMLGVQITDVLDPSSPHMIGSYRTNGLVYGISLDHPFAYVAAGGLAVLNVSDPHNPEVLGIFGRNLLKDAYDITGSGNLLCVGSDNGIVIFDISNPHVPLFQSYLPLYYARRMLSSDTLLFAANPFLHIIDCSHATNPQIIYSDDSLYICDFEMHDGLLHVAAARDTFPFFLIYDIQNPANPQLLGDVDIYQYPTSLAVADTFAYVSNEIYSQVINIADPTDPFIVSTFTLSNVYDMEIAGNKLFCIGEYQSGSRGSISVFDLMDPTIPHQIASTPLYGLANCNKLSVRNNVIYCCNREAFAIYEFAETDLAQKKPEENWFSHLLISPNPFCDVLRIQLSISNTTQDISIQVFDVTGRLMKEFLFSAKPNRTHIHLVWNGTDMYNRKVPSGTCFLKIQQGNNSYSKKILRMK